MPNIKLKDGSGTPITYSGVNKIRIPSADDGEPAEYIGPTGKINITNTNEINVSSYATAQVVDANLVPENIKKDMTILGITGTHAGGGGATEPYIEETYNVNGYLIDVKMYGYTKVREYAFYGCSSLALTSLPSGITSIGTRAFQSCSKLALTSLPSRITSIGNNAFGSCSSLALTSLPSGITSIGDNAFDNCQVLALTSLPSGITSIGSSVFYGCKKLTNIEIAAKTLGTGTKIFGNCTGLQKVWFRNTCTTVTAASASNAPFAGCSTSLQIYCEASSKPSGYGTYFNRTGSSGGTTVTVVYGQTTRPW